MTAGPEISTEGHRRRPTQIHKIIQQPERYALSRAVGNPEGTEPRTSRSQTQGRYDVFEYVINEPTSQ